MGEITITTILQARGPAAAVVLSEAQAEAVGEGAKAFPVKATINGYTWDGRVTRMRGECLLGMSKAIRTAAGAEAGDEVEAHIVLDSAPREVELPPALAAALDADPDGARAKFDALAFTHRKEYARWIAEAKRDETRDRRLAQAVTMINAGQTRS
jgi:uncharacterized protein YdeI (YjbR/CyaY-like superfamily)